MFGMRSSWRSKSKRPSSRQRSGGVPRQVARACEELNSANFSSPVYRPGSRALGLTKFSPPSECSDLRRAHRHQGVGVPCLFQGTRSPVSAL